MFEDIINCLKTTQFNCCLSGGAKGSDFEWGKLAIKNNHELIHFSFSDHNYKGHDILHRINVPLKYLNQSNHSLELASKTLKRPWPVRSPYATKLIQRNYFQILHASSVYAVSSFDTHTGLVQGGTAWATQMFIDRHNALTPYEECKCYVLDKISNVWHQWIYNNWEIVEDIPQPDGIWAGIGSRDINRSNIESIEKIF